jgi:catechol 2,3-dioxygenase-like lactoylglutathione lyase family enzyme
MGSESVGGESDGVREPATASVNHVGLCVTDLGRSRVFYENAFGFTYRNELEPGDAVASQLLRVAMPVGVTAVYLELDRFVLELLHFDRDGNDPARVRSFTEPGLTHLSFGVDDVAATCDLVRSNGGEVLDDTDLDGIAVMTRDPDGQLLELLPRR